MIYAVTGGKGGVGKTTATLLWAWRLKKQGESPLLIDADVEAPNLHLFLGAGQRIAYLTQAFPRIANSCTGCGLCVKHCPNNALVAGKPPTLMPAMCEGCGVCAAVCPVQAIEMAPQRVGEIKETRAEFRLIYAELTTIVEETGGFVQQLVGYAHGTTVIDTAPGTHCSVIRALAPADKVLVVVEPTPLGLHDFSVMQDLLRSMGKDYGIVINKAVDNEYLRQIKQRAQKNGIEIAMEIPYDEELARAYARGEPFWKRF